MQMHMSGVLLDGGGVALDEVLEEGAVVLLLERRILERRVDALVLGLVEGVSQRVVRGSSEGGAAGNRCSKSEYRSQRVCRASSFQR